MKCYKLEVTIMAENMDDLFERLEDTSVNPIDDYWIKSIKRYEEGDTE